MRFFIFFLILLASGVLKAQYIPEPEAKRMVSVPLSKPILSKTHSLTLPFFDDFFYGLDTNKWVNLGFCTVKYGLSNKAPNNGVLTFDGIDSSGYVYDTDPSYGSADFIQSRSIDLSPYTPSDSLYLSFYFSHGQLGDPAEVNDSLLLYFFNKNGVYDKIWFRTGGDTLDGFVHIHLPIKDSLYFHSMFHLKFQSFASRNGLYDIFMVDYLTLDAHRNASDTTYHDISFSAVSNMRMGLFSALPWKHMQSTALWPGYKISVNSLQANNTQRLLGAKIEAENGQLLGGTTVYSQFYSFPRYVTAYPLPAFSSQNIDTSTTLKVSFTLSPDASDTKPQNDTLIQYFRCDSIVAYDDGEAEVAFGRQGAKQFLQRFILPHSDSLRAVWMQFVPTSLIPDGKGFRMVAYTSLGKPAAHDSYFNLKITKNNAFQRFRLDSLLYIKDTIYVGIYQDDLTPIGIGLDRSANNDAQIFWDSSRVWLNTQIEGTLMIRLELTDGAAPTVNREPLNASPFSCYPNPSSGIFTITGPPTVWQAQDLQGKSVPLTQSENQIIVNHSTPGMYFLETYWQGKRFTYKIVVQP